LSVDRRQILRVGFAGLAMAAFPRIALAQGADPFAMVDPELRPMARIIARATGQGVAFKPPVDVPLPDGVVERSVAGRDGAPDVKVYVVNAMEGAALRGAILHIHGGGFVGGNARMGLRAVQRLAWTLDCVIVSVDYRLAPATRFPGSLEDNYAALKWVHGNAATLGVDPSRIALLGESAGGGHAAMLAIAARDRGEVPIAFQALVYPMLDDRTGSTRPVPSQIGTLIWTAQDNRNGWAALLGQPAGGPRVPAGAVPARVERLVGLPPAFIGVGTLDLFVDEDIDYARRLIAAGVPTELMVVPGAFHGFEQIVPQAGVSKRFTAALENALARALASRREAL